MRDTHERLTREEPGPSRGSDRAFGLAFAAVFTIVGLFPPVLGHSPREWALAVAGALLAVALVYPRALSPLNRVWFHVARFLHRIVSAVALALLFTLAVTPTGLAMRLLRRDPLRLRRDGEAASYWIAREPPGPPPRSMERQY